MRACPKCGSDVFPGASDCPKCGVVFATDGTVVRERPDPTDNENHSMTRNERASIRATVATGAVLALFAIPVINLIASIFLMLPLWAVDNLGIVDLGSEKNGFFIPNLGGVVFGISALWTLWFLIFRVVIAREFPETKTGEVGQAVAVNSSKTNGDQKLQPRSALSLYVLLSMAALAVGSLLWSLYAARNLQAEKDAGKKFLEQSAAVPTGSSVQLASSAEIKGRPVTFIYSVFPREDPVSGLMAIVDVSREAGRAEFHLRCVVHARDFRYDNPCSSEREGQQVTR